MKLDPIRVKGSGAYVEVMVRDDKPVARLNFFDTDAPVSRESLAHFIHALQEASAKLADLETTGMNTIEAHCHRAAAEVATWPKWKRDCMNMTNTRSKEDDL